MAFNGYRSTPCRRTGVKWVGQAGKGRGQQGSVKYGFTLVKGKANHPMEDYHVAKFIPHQGRGLGLFAIYDGHLGHSVPAIVKQFNAEECVQYQLDALMFNDQPLSSYSFVVNYFFFCSWQNIYVSSTVTCCSFGHNHEVKLAGFDPFERSLYFGPYFDLGQFERFRRLFHHSAYRALLNHKESQILSTLNIEENRYKQRVWIRGARPEEEETFQFTMVQRVGGFWDGYWLTESVLHDGDSFSGGVAY
ncbi:uncharacterized protein [Rutidosis leptorrhynchoides]|uniref:uncharacterized protein n=1 Tax=Rutidosis leptorrhynchoides TaxID=125765 RepID=UPI003A99A23C